MVDKIKYSCNPEVSEIGDRGRLRFWPVSLAAAAGVALCLLTQDNFSAQNIGIDKNTVRNFANSVLKRHGKTVYAIISRYRLFCGGAVVIPFARPLSSQNLKKFTSGILDNKQLRNTDFVFLLLRTQPIKNTMNTRVTLYVQFQNSKNNRFVGAKASSIYIRPPYITCSKKRSKPPKKQHTPQRPPVIPPMIFKHKHFRDI